MRTGILPRIGVLALGLALSAVSAAGCTAANAGERTTVAPPSPTVASSAAPSTDVASNPSARPPGGPAPDGRISQATLMHTKLNLPAWPKGSPSTCTTRNVTLLDPHVEMSVPVLMEVVYGDADGDGAKETITILGCSQGEAFYQQVVVFDRNAAGHIVTRGQVVRMGGDIKWITDVAAGAPGSVRVQVADLQPCCAVRPENALRQWRTYSWNGNGFQQTGGPTKFGVNPLRSDLKITTSGITFAPRAGDHWYHGTITVTIHNGGPGRADEVQVRLTFPKLTVRHEGAAWSACTLIDEDTVYSASIGFELRASLAAGQTRTLVLGFAASQPMTGKGQAYLSERLEDLAYTDNETTFKVG
jgi:hypothetical protein